MSYYYTDPDFNELWEYMENYGIATYDEMCLVIDINGRNVDTLEDILFSRTGYRNLKQIQESGEY